jgi:hypothetical protein
MAWHSRSAVAQGVWLAISTRRAMCASSLHTCLMTKATQARHNVSGLVRFRTQIFALAAEVHGEFYFS